ncbi:hypothetical protein C8Q76DRAFT_698523 [Earliella scabrosa]|nr:hypothetical protein C8Q76DRAFT_698523 [Earliella scabrosa]
MVGRALLKLEVQYGDAGEHKISVHLPMSLTPAYDLLDAAQLEAIKTTLYLLRYFGRVSLPESASEAWDEFIERMSYAAETTLRFQTPGDEVLYDIQLWARSRIPDAFPRTSVVTTEAAIAMEEGASSRDENSDADGTEAV